MDLWDEFRAGKAGARDALIRHYLPLIKSASKSYAVPNVLSEDDLESEGMLAANKALDECLPTWNPEAWLRTAVQNRCRSKQRDALKSAAHLGPSLDAPVGEDGGLREEVVGALDPALMQFHSCLTPHQRRVMVMLTFQKMTHQEVGSKLKRSVKRIQATERAARRKLARAEGLKTVTEKGRVKLCRPRVTPKRQSRFGVRWQGLFDPPTRDRLGKLAQGAGVSEAEAVRRLIRAAEEVPAAVGVGA